MTLEDRLLRSSVVCFILDLVIVLVGTYLWISLAMKAMTKRIGVCLLLLVGVFTIIILGTNSLGYLVTPITAIFISFLILNHTAKKEAEKPSKEAT